MLPTTILCENLFTYPLTLNPRSLTSPINAYLKGTSGEWSEMIRGLRFEPKPRLFKRNHVTQTSSSSSLRSSFSSIPSSSPGLCFKPGSSSPVSKLDTSHLSDVFLSLSPNSRSRYRLQLFVYSIFIIDFARSANLYYFFSMLPVLRCVHCYDVFISIRLCTSFLNK